MPRAKGKLPRPPISDSIRVKVALRQLIGFNEPRIALQRVAENLPEYLERLLGRLANYFGCPRDQLRLDHDPALENREKVYHRGVHVDYRPAGSDPDWLAYRPHGAEYARSHYVKTNVRGDHGQLSDNALARKLKRMARARTMTSDRGAKIKIGNRKLQSRPFLKGRGFQKRYSK